jgi:hypothetical protein
LTANPQPPAICDTCGTVFTIPFFGGTGTVKLTNVSFGPCPNCGGNGSVPDGLYQFTGDALNVFSTWPVDRLQRIVDAIQAARNAPNPQAAVQNVLRTEPELSGLARTLASLRDPQTVLAFIVVLLTTLQIVLSQAESGSTTTIKEQTVIEQVIREQPTPAVASRATAKRPPPPADPTQTQTAR